MTLREIHRSLFHRADEPSAPENIRSAAWQAGFATALSVGPRCDHLAVITSEWISRGRPFPLTADYREWKAGFFAAHFQQLESELQQPQG